MPEESSEQAEEGRLLHEFMAKPEMDRTILNKEHQHLLDTCDRMKRDVYDMVDARFYGLTASALASGRETTFWLHRGIKSIFPGHADLWEVAKTTEGHLVLIIIDWKFGRKIVTPAAANLQLRSYAVMGSEIHSPDFVVVAIGQPRLPAADRLTVAIYSRHDIRASRAQLFEIWDACKEPDAPLHASEESCQYCRARTFCPELNKAMSSGLALVPTPPAGTVRAREASLEKSLQTLTDNQIARMLEAVKFADFVSGPLMEEARRRLEAGQLDGYKLGKSSEVREVTDVGEAVRILQESGVPQSEIFAACKMKLGEIEDAYREAHGKCTWSEAKDAVNQLLGGVITRHSKAPAVVKDTANKIAA